MRIYIGNERKRADDCTTAVRYVKHTHMYTYLYVRMYVHSRICICTLYRYSKATGNEGVMSATNRYNPPKKQLPTPLAKRVVKNNRVKITLSVKNPMVVLLEGIYMQMYTICVYTYLSIHTCVYIHINKYLYYYLYIFVIRPCAT